MIVKDKQGRIWNKDTYETMKRHSYINRKHVVRYLGYKTKNKRIINKIYKREIKRNPMITIEAMLKRNVKKVKEKLDERVFYIHSDTNNSMEELERYKTVNRLFHPHCRC